LRQRGHFVLGEVAAHITHLFMRTPAGFEVLKLIEKIHIVLAREIWHLHVLGDAVYPMARGALIDYFLQVSIIGCQCGGWSRNDDHADMQKIAHPAKHNMNPLSVFAAQAIF
jgi:hypothetical protein